MDIRPGSRPKTVSDIRVDKPVSSLVSPTLEEEYGEWLSVPLETEESKQAIPPSFVPPVFTYEPKKKRRWRIPKMRGFSLNWKVLIGWVIGLGIVFVLGTAALLWLSKDLIEARAEAGFASLEKAKTALIEEKYEEADKEFALAKTSFEEAKGAIPFWSRPLLALTGYIPGLSEGASAQNVLDAGIHIANSGPAFVEITSGLYQNRQKVKAGQEFSILGFFEESKEPLARAEAELKLADKALQKVNIADVPQEKQKNFHLAQGALPVLLGMIETFGSHEAVIREILGAHGPRKYLFLLENNHELRATGGFIGTYALLEMNDGVVKNFFVDGIFNPDGQLRENIVPPKPLQKVSAGWSLHDSNWFPDFPTSAEKAIFFYEKTGGPTVDGVMTFTPEIMLKLLEVTGPIELPEYGITVTHENFFPAIQTEVEVNYDKKENKPKQVLADLSQILFDKLLESKDEKTLLGVAKILIESLNQKQMLLYVRDSRVENIIKGAGWSGEIKKSDRDYLSVIHSNINGYKTDGVIKDSVNHKVTIEADGSIIDTLRITRKHNGGNTPYEWWNKVNANYMRVYVPLGSELLSAKGHTYEFPESPLDYDALGFRRDETVVALESTEKIDEDTGTRVSTEFGKTVFGNWVYVSPGEEVTVEYVYKLPFRVTPGEGGVGESTYSLLYQKQAGTDGASFDMELAYPDKWKSIWQTGRNLVPYENTFRLTDTISTDLFMGVAFDVAR